MSTKRNDWIENLKELLYLYLLLTNYCNVALLNVKHSIKRVIEDI